MHPTNRKILVQTQDRLIHTLDIRIYRFLTEFDSAALAAKANITSQSWPIGGALERSGLFDGKAPASSLAFNGGNMHSELVESPLIRATFSACGYQVWSGLEERSES